MAEDEMSLQLSMALSGIERDQWEEMAHKKLYDQGVSVLEQVRSSSSSSASNSEHTSYSSPNTTIRTATSTCTSSSQENSSDNAYPIIRTFDSDVNLRKSFFEFVRSNNMRIINQFESNERLDAEVARQTQQFEKLEIHHDPALETPPESDTEVDFDDDDSGSSRAVSCIGAERSNTGTPRQYDNPETNSHEIFYWNRSARPLPIDEPSTSAYCPVSNPDTPDLKADLEIQWHGRNILDLAENLRGNADMYIHPEIPSGSTSFFLNRSPISRLRGPTPPPPNETYECPSCDYEETAFDY